MAFAVANKKQFNEKIKKEKQIVVAFYSSNTSNYASSVVDDLAKSTSEYGNIKFLKVDVDEDIDLRNLASSQFISSTPAFVYLKEGKKRDLHYGADADEVKEFLTDALKK
ncbi:Thioredoxin H-type [Morella rubra]|uniref:Thioredoxin H-type n=1 Tax=Morella rubra TaxID=262757 RepID=A0A6A1VZ64_9ROSI|nr:Thioredoxin H-type [Morella rubra]